MKTESEIPDKTIGAVIALGTLAAALGLFAPLPGEGTLGVGLRWPSSVAGNALAALALVGAAFWACGHRFWRRTEHRRVRNGVALAVTQALLLRGAIELGQPAVAPAWLWWSDKVWLWTPWFLVTGLGVMLLGSRPTVLLSLMGVFLLYLRADPGPLGLVGCLVASIAGILLLRRPTRGRILRAGAGSGALLGMVAVAERTLSGTPIGDAALAGVVPLVLGVVAGFVLLAFLPVVEWVLGEVSDVSLVEYGDHPLLDQLKEQAPGTWHHSLNVADLAEKAASALGGRALLCRTAALYHDIGKLKEPQMFAENIVGPSPHESLDPRESAKRIIDHVTDGLDMARKAGLPKLFQQIIAEHHGCSLVRIFYAQACHQLRPGEDPDSIRPLFSYPGPKPSSRESGLISLADMVEAATRSFVPASESEARALVAKLIAERVAAGELGECPLTLPELARVEETFADWVKMRHHLRPAYPRPANVSPVKARDALGVPHAAELT